MAADRRELAAIFAGGVLGALGRAGLVELMPHGFDAWPWPTFLVNMWERSCSDISRRGCRSACRCPAIADRCSAPVCAVG